MLEPDTERTHMNAPGTSLQTHFTTFDHIQRDLSADTISSYRDTWRMLLKYLTATLGIPAATLDFGAVTATNVTGFLDHLEQERGNNAKTRNTRLTAIRSVLGRALPDHPDMPRPLPTNSVFSVDQKFSINAVSFLSLWTIISRRWIPLSANCCDDPLNLRFEPLSL